MPATPPLSRISPLPLSYDEPLRLKVIELHVWAVSEGLRGTEAAQLFDGLCQRLLDAGVPLWRAFAGMRTLHPQWGGYGYTWRRQLNTLEPRQFVRGDEYEGRILNSPIGYLIRRGAARLADAKRPRCGGRHRLLRRGRPVWRRRRRIARNWDRLFLCDGSAV